MKRTYLVTRVVIATVIFALFFTIVLVYFFAFFIQNDFSLVVFLPIILFLTGFTYAVYKCIYIPYNNVKKTLNLFAAGYTIEDIYAQKYSLSVEIDQVLNRLDEYLFTDKTLEANRNQSKYLALQNQINPHFLYNALEGIRSEAINKNDFEIANITESLATFFRYTISNVENEVTIREEIECVKNYFSIQKYRFEDKLSLVADFPEEVLDILFMPKLILQPLVENTIIHGLEPKNDKGEIELSISLTENRVTIYISDNGVGMDEMTLFSIQERLARPYMESVKSDGKSSVGLSNVNNRIKLLYGEEYGLNIYSTLDVGTDIEVNIPAITQRKETKL